MKSIKNLFSAVLVTISVFFLYPMFKKKRFLSGNFIFSALCSFLILLAIISFDNTIPLFIILIYLSILFLLILIHEIFRDMENIGMDIAYHFRTLPIILGIDKTQKIILVLKIICVWLILIHISITYKYLWIKATYSSYGHLFSLLFFIILPLLTAVYLFLFKYSENYSRSRMVIKLILITGILSMIFLKM
jgi:4-hydroxybenzoate polyprenyltransferase